MESKISVAMATYNGADYLEEQLISIVNQSIIPDEIIIVDDFSKDSTVEMIDRIREKYSFIKLYRNEVNLGPIQTFKKAVSLCTNEYVALCDQDDIWEKNKLELCFNQLKSLGNNKPSIVFSDLKMIDTKGNLINDSFWATQGYKPSKTNLKELLIGNIITGCTIMMNQKMKDEIARMPVGIIMHDYWIAIIAYSIGDYRIIADSLIKYRVHSTSVTVKSKITFIERVKLFLQVFWDYKKLYLNPNIIQTELFFNIYKNELSEGNSKLLEKFISLKKYNSLYRRLYVFRVKYLSIL